MLSAHFFMCMSLLHLPCNQPSAFWFRWTRVELPTTTKREPYFTLYTSLNKLSLTRINMPSKSNLRARGSATSYDSFSFVHEHNYSKSCKLVLACSSHNFLFPSYACTNVAAWTGTAVAGWPHWLRDWALYPWCWEELKNLKTVLSCCTECNVFF